MGSPTYGQTWVISGHPEREGTGNWGNLVGTVGSEDGSGGWPDPYDNEPASPSPWYRDGGVVLVDDESPAKPWVSKAVQAKNEISGKHKYNPFGKNSNGFAKYVLRVLGLLDELDKAMRKRKEEYKQRFPWSPGWNSLDKMKRPVKV